MVTLSLAHRVKMDRQASILDADGIPNRGGALLVLLACIAVFNVFFVCIGAILAAIIDYSWTDGAASRPSSWYQDGSVTRHRVDLAFFYCTIPIVLSALSVYDTCHLWRSHGKSSPIKMLVSAFIGIVLWAIQFGLQANCIWSFVYQVRDDRDYCPFAFSGWNPRGFWSTGLVAAWVVPWMAIAIILLYIAYSVLSIMALRKPRSSTRDDGRRQRSYSYRGVDAPEVQTDRDVPEVSVANDDESKSPSYRTGSVFSEDLPAEKEKYMV